MKIKNNGAILIIASICLSLFLVSCGDRSGNGAHNIVGNGGENTGGIIGTGFAEGPITGFGSIYVNGIKFETDNASILLDNETVAQSELKVGMIVKIRGEIDSNGETGKALSINFEKNLNGPIDSIDLNLKQIVLLGRIVQVNELTVFHDCDLLTLTNGNVVSISGFTNSFGVLEATYIKFKEASFIEGEDNINIKGLISSLDTVNQTFKVQDLIISYRDAVFKNFTKADLTDNLLVKIKSNSAVVDGVLIPDEIQLKDKKIEGNSGDDVKVEGLVTSIVSASLIMVNDQVVNIDNDTEFENGTVADLILNVKVEIKGRLNSSAQLQAEKIKIKKSSDIKITGKVQTVNSTSIKILGVKVLVDRFTILKDDLEEAQNFNLTYLKENDWVEIKAFINADNKIVATLLERGDNEGDEEKVELKATIGAINQPNLTILGIEVQVIAGQTVFENLAGGNENDSDAFFASIEVGSLIEVEGVFDGINLIADEIELEDDSDEEEVNKVEIDK